ncbi:MAG: hypothetical protein HXX81_07255 [Campylobacterales bacterium]|nr:hypothetical protein [Campylobacterales bacterium]
MMSWSEFTFIKNIKFDLESWRESIFVTQNANNIHYLDSSLFSSCLQLELNLNEQHSSMDDESDLMDIFF